MFITDTMLRRPIAKAAVATAAAAALAAGLSTAQAASAGASGEEDAVVRAASPRGGDNGGRLVAAPMARSDERPAPAPDIERAAEPRGSTTGLAPAPAPATSDGSHAQSP